MEKLWYTLSSNVLENMIHFASKNEDKNCPTFLLEIETIIPLLNRYVMNLIDGTNKSIFCITASEYSKTLCDFQAVVGNLIRILRYWLFQIQTDHNNQNECQHKYIIMVLDAEIVTLAPTKPIETIKRVASKTPRIRGIVESCFGVSNTDDGCQRLQFRLRDDTGSIGCTVWGSLCLKLEPILKEGLKLEVSHAMVTKAEPEYRLYDDDVELKLTEFSIFKIYNPYDLSLLYTHPSTTVNEIVSSKAPPMAEINSDFETTKEPTKELKYHHQTCSNGEIPVPLASVRRLGKCKSWIRGIIEKYIGQHTTRTQHKIIIFNIRDDSTIALCTVWEPMCLAMHGIIKEGDILELMNAMMKPNQINYNGSNAKFEISITKFASMNALSRDGSLLYQHIMSNATKTRQQESGSTIESTKLPVQVNSNPSTTISSNKIISLNDKSNCLLWVRGTLEIFHGTFNTRTSRTYISFDLCDDTASISCKVWEPLSVNINKKIKEGMILKIWGYKIVHALKGSKNNSHQYQLQMNTFTSVEVFNSDNLLVYSHIAKQK